MGKYLVWGLYSLAVFICLYWIVSSLVNGQPELGLLKPLVPLLAGSLSV